MKKIIIFGALAVIISGSFVYSACPIESLGACKADIGSGINDTLNDKILPNRLDQQIKPNNSFNNRTNLGQPNLPDTINMEPIRQENTQPYNADCQFGNCMNRPNSGGNQNK